MDRRLLVPWVVLLMAPGMLAMRSSGHEHGHEGRDSSWVDMWKLKPKLHSRANRTTFPKIPGVWRERFGVVKQLGNGSFGTVYQMQMTCESGTGCSCTSSPSYVSAKLVSKVDGDLKDEIKRMQTHFSEYVVSTIGVPDTVRSPEGQWVMMPYLNSGSLKDLIDKCKDNDACFCKSHNCSCQGRMQPWPCWEEIGLSLPYVLALFDEVLEGLESIHKAGLAHMDMKPENIMLQCVGGSCYALVIDLGAMCDKTKPNNEIKGTWGYIAPEVFRPPRIGGIPSNDVWAMGVTLFQLLYMANPDYITTSHGKKTLWKKELKYQPEKDQSPTERTTLDQLMVDMLDFEYTTRIGLPEVRKRLRRIIELEKPKQEVMDMIHKTPTERGLSNTLPDCINTPTDEELMAEEDEEELLGGAS